MTRRFIGSVFGNNLPINVASAPEPGVYEPNSCYYIKEQGGWLIAGNTYQFDIVSAPVPSGDTGRTIDLDTEPENQFTFQAGGTYTISFNNATAVDWEIMGGGGNGGTGGRGENDRTNPGSPGTFGGDSVVSTPSYSITSGGGTGGAGGPNRSSVGSPGVGGNITITFTDPNGNPGNIPGVVTQTRGYFGGSQQNSPPSYEGTIGPPSLGVGFAGANGDPEGGPGGAGGKGGGGGGGAFVSIRGQVTTPTYDIVCTPGNGIVRVIRHDGS